MFTFNELKERLKAATDEVTLLELLEITSEDILDRFEDRLEEKYDFLCKEFSDETEEFDGALDS